MSLQDIYSMEKSANMVVLSACETSLGELIEGEGVMSLARGFFHSGANSVVSTQWKVNDKSSAEIVTTFYKQLKKGKSKSEALRNAKLAYLDKHSLTEASPYYWAPFVVLGDTSPMDIGNGTNVYFPVLLLTIIFLIAIVLYKKKRPVSGPPSNI